VGGWNNPPRSETIDVVDAAEVRPLVDLDGGWATGYLKQHKNPASERFMIVDGVDRSAWPDQENRFGEWATSRLRL
jgi:hypothetical protein